MGIEEFQDQKRQQKRIALRRRMERDNSRPVIYEEYENENETMLTRIETPAEPNRRRRNINDIWISENENVWSL